jgi:hypothetical protein
MNILPDLPSVEEMREHAAMEPRKFSQPKGYGDNPDDTFEYERILRNQIITPDGTLLVSEYRHDYRTYRDANGFTYMVDGGNAYLRRNVVKEAPYEELSIYVTDDHEVNRRYFMWTSYGVDGTGPEKTQVLKDMDTDHIHAILDGGFGAKEARILFEEELTYRGNQALDELVEQSEELGLYE